VPGFYPHRLKPAPELLVGQFLICTRAELIPPGWRTLAHGRWIISWAAPLSCAPCRSPNGQIVGWVLGHAIHPEQGWVENDSVIPVGADAAGFEGMVNRLRGRFIAIEIEGAALRVFPDACTSLAAVFAPAEECVASTSTLIPLSQATPFDVDTILWTDIPYSDSMYPMGLTPRRGVERLLPNHALCTGSWEHRRIWPTGDILRDRDADTVARVLGEGIRHSLVAAARAGPLELALTAGIDTRLILSCARDLCEGATFYTGDLADELGLPDVVISRQIAGRFGLRHRVVPRIRPRRRDLADWVIRTGGEVGELRGWRGCLTLAAQVPGSISITGTTGNVVGHGPLRSRPFQDGVSPEAVVRRASVRERPDFVARARRWLEGIPSDDVRLLGDLLFLEQRHGCWGGVIEYSELGLTRARLCPILSIAELRDVFQLPIEARRKRQVSRRTIELFWPELLEFPFNKEYVSRGPRIRYYRLKEAIGRQVGRVRRVIRRSREQPEYLPRRLGMALRHAE
jgi:hypothetical protein